MVRLANLHAHWFCLSVIWRWKIRAKAFPNVMKTYSCPHLGKSFENVEYYIVRNCMREEELGVLIVPPSSAEWKMHLHFNRTVSDIQPLYTKATLYNCASVTYILKNAGIGYYAVALVHCKARRGKRNKKHLHNTQYPFMNLQTCWLTASKLHSKLNPHHASILCHFPVNPVGDKKSVEYESVMWAHASFWGNNILKLLNPQFFSLPLWEM